MTSSLLQIFAGLFVVRNDSEANEQLLRFESDPVKFNRELSQEVLAASIYLTPHGAEDIQARERARALLQRVIIATYKRLKVITEKPEVATPSNAPSDLLRLLDEIAFRVYLALDLNTQLRSDSLGLTDSARKNLYFELKPILALLTLRAEIPGRHYLAPRTAHNLMETFMEFSASIPAR